MSTSYEHAIEIRNRLARFMNPYTKKAGEFGADYIGYRYFEPDGSSFGLTTNDQWYATEKNEEFYKHQKRHLERELKLLFTKGLRYVTRSGEATENKYLSSLCARGMGNSVGIYRFSNHKVEHYFFIAGSGELVLRDFMINNLINLEKLVDEISCVIPLAFESLAEKPSAEFRVSQEVINLIFRERKLENTRSALTRREAEVLLYLKSGYNNKMIAKELDISIRTVHSFIEKIKGKFSCNRNQLITVINRAELQDILREKS